ncbi:enoyl-CoA hydratase/isomerase family protein [Paracoccus sp. (in: a-proteobacteria)]|uniref:enoyl-CoA hydratase/isomerase family protein n=1 Tax=Paracoccus sp. TaxID=267 RepID=UPI002AFFB861|nr:enoyl-CoA hydratase/isomerase family protein [Paracoccus sp. (in: a-proteobacteria)]
MNSRTTTAQASVNYSVIDGVAVALLDAPPVNALSVYLRRELCDAMDRAAADPTVRAVVLGSTGKIFCAGADITEFGKPPVAPSLPEVLSRIEGSPKPVVAAITGAALGGGCELTLACHARVAGPKAGFGLPEVKLGLIPGAGGTQRLPRILPPADAFAMMLSGRSIKADEAAAKGLADEIANDPIAAARALALHLADAGSWPVTSARKIADGGAEAFAEAAADARRKHGGLLSTGALIRAVQAALTKPFQEGLAVEREEFLKLIPSDQAVALRHVFFAERIAGHIPGGGKGNDDTGRGKHRDHRRRHDGRRHCDDLCQRRYPGAVDRNLARAA